MAFHQTKTLWFLEVAVAVLALIFLLYRRPNA